MSSMDRGPRQLAEAVLRALSLTVIDVPVPSGLAYFFDVLYEASFRTERGEPLACSLLWQDPAAFQPGSHAPAAPPEAPLSHRREAWARPGKCGVAFTPPLPFTVSSVVQLAQALEPDASAMAVYAGEAQTPMIYGLVNYGTDSSHLSPAEWETQAGVCGTFRAAILGPAHISVEAGLDYPIELRRNSLRAHSHAVLRRGPVRERLRAALGNLFPDVRALLPADLADSPFLEAEALPLKEGSVLRREFDWADTLARLWLDTLTRLLLKIRENGGGGMALITPSAPDAPQSGLKLPYALDYGALRRLLEERGAYWLAQFAASAQALSEQPRTADELRPDEGAFQEPDPASGPPGSDREIGQAIGFVAALARMEGILLLTPQLEARGFGGRPTGGEAGESREDSDEEIYLAATELAEAETLAPVPGYAFGPRCQTLLRQCRRDPNAVGFFLTQDGDLRAMMQHEGKVIVWDPVRLPRE